MKRRITSALALAALGAAGTFLALAFAPVANAWDWTTLPNGYSVHGEVYQLADGSSCHKISIDNHYMGDDCVDPAGLNAAVNAYVDATICTVNPAAGGTACAPSSTSTPSTTNGPGTTTAPPSTDPGTATTQAPPPATTAPATTTTIDTTAAEIASLEARITALEQQIAALTSRVTLLEKAGEASWLAYQQAIAKGDDPGTAADIARGTWLNVVYGLGDFAR